MLKHITFFVFIFSILGSPAFSKTECHNHGECSGGKGCYPSDPGNSSDKDDEFLIEWMFGKKDLGKECSKDGQCQSGSCVDVCKERESNGNCKKSVKECGEYSECMFAPMGEIAPPGRILNTGAWALFILLNLSISDLLKYLDTAFKSVWFSSLSTITGDEYSLLAFAAGRPL